MSRLAPRNQIYEIYKPRTSNGFMLIGADSEWHFNPLLIPRIKYGHTFLASFQASSWTRAKEVYESFIEDYLK